MTITDTDKFRVGNSLPNRSSLTPADPVPPDMVGAQIIKIGSAPDRLEIEGGGLVVEYRPVGGKARRVIFAFNENGMWVHDAIS